MPHCCCGFTLPTSSPSRPASTAPICSTSTRAVSPSRSISGRNDAGLALREVGATRITERGRNSLAWTITPYRRPPCSCPVPRGRRNSWTSPRSTHALHHGRDLEHLAPVVFVGLECSHLGGQRGTPLQPGGAVEDRPADSFRPAQACGFQLGQRLESLGVQAHADG